jgi:hypothetical protein
MPTTSLKASMIVDDQGFISVPSKSLEHGTAIRAPDHRLNTPETRKIQTYPFFCLC